MRTPVAKMPDPADVELPIEREPTSAEKLRQNCLRVIVQTPAGETLCEYEER